MKHIRVFLLNVARRIVERDDQFFKIDRNPRPAEKQAHDLKIIK